VRQWLDGHARGNGPALRMCLASRPSSMKRASAAWVVSGECQSVTYLAARSAFRSVGGATRKPSRSDGSIVLEKVPM